MANPTFEEILRAWMLEYDDRLPSESRERKEAFLILLGNLKDHGYGKEELTAARKEKIIKSCVNPNHRNKNKLRVWVSMVVKDLEGAVLIHYGTVKIRKDVITPEMSAKLDGIQAREKESKANKNSDSSEDVEDKGETDLLDMEDPSLDIATKTGSDSKVIETTDEMLEKMSGPEAVWDEDLINELGIKIYE